MKQINYRQGGIHLVALPESKNKFYKLFANAAILFGDFAKIYIKNCFSHYRYTFLGKTICFIPAYEMSACHYHYGPNGEAWAIPGTKEIIKEPDRFFVYGG